MHCSRGTAIAVGEAKIFPVQVVVGDVMVQGAILGLCVCSAAGGADLMLAASDVMDYFGNSRRRRNTIGSH